MKKMLTVALAMVLFLVPTGCANRGETPSSSGVESGTTSPLPDPAEAYAKATREMRAVLEEGSFTSQTEGSLDIRTSGESFTIYMSSRTDAYMGDPCSLYIRQETSSSSGTALQSAFLDGDTLYLYRQGGTYQRAVSEEDKAAIREENLIAVYDPATVPPAASSAQALAEGGYTVSLVFDPSQAEAIDQLFPDLTDQIGGADPEVQSLTLTVQIGGDGLIQSQSYDIEMRLTLDGHAADVTMHMDTDYSNINGDFVLTPPEEMDLGNALPLDEEPSASE